MKLSEGIDTVVDQLELALGSGGFPKELHQWGTQLLSHLRKPVQVAVVGAPNSGKSSLINMMVGQRAIPDLGEVSVIEVAGGPAPRTLFETGDGTILRFNGMLADATVPPGSVRARQELPNQELIDKNFIEVGLSGSFGQQKSVVNWVTQWADIVLWCTDCFDENEQRLWSEVPEEIKDHGCLVLTKADQHLMRGVLSENIEALETIVSEEFLGLYPIATLQAIAARVNSEQPNDSLWKSSGGKELLDCISWQVHSGRSADLDQVEILLQQLPANAPLETAGTSIGSAKPQIQENKTAIAVSGEATNGVISPTNAPGKEQLLEEALSLLQECANDLLHQVGDGKGPSANLVLDRCVQATKTLCDTLMVSDSEDTTVRDLQDDAQESTEVMMLLSLEKGEDAAEDAVTLLLQLKKEIGEQVTNQEMGHKSA